MIPVSTLYDEYIERPNSFEHKKPLDYIVPPPSRGVGTTIRLKAVFKPFGSKLSSKLELIQLINIIFCPRRCLELKNEFLKNKRQKTKKNLCFPK